MDAFPLLRTVRLILREFGPADAPELRQIAQAREIARTMLNLPHPYDEGVAEEWIASLRPMFETGTGTTFAVVLREGAPPPRHRLVVHERLRRLGGAVGPGRRTVQGR